MALQKKGKYYYGDSRRDIENELGRYSEGNYLATHFAAAVCACEGQIFKLLLNEDVGVAIRRCVACQGEHPIGDSADYLEEAELEECECPCGENAFEITVGVALYAESEDVKWLYIGCRCVACGLTACYGDWKNEYENFRDFLKLI